MFAGDPQLRIGTSSWSSTDWVGLFYPPGTRSEHFMKHYSSVVRWLGDHKAIEKITTSWKETVLDRSPIISDWVDVMNELRNRVRIIYGFFNNHFAGPAPASVEEFRRPLAARRTSVDG